MSTKPEHEAGAGSGGSGAAGSGSAGSGNLGGGAAGSGGTTTTTTTMTTSTTTSDSVTDCAGACAVEACCGGACVDLQTASDHCGACGNTCLAGRTCAEGACTPPWVTMSSMGAPSPREGAAAAWTGSAMFVWGGHDFFSDRNDGGLYDPASDAWTSVAGGAGAPSPRSMAAAVWTGTKVLVWGGGLLWGMAALGDGALYDPASATWTSVSNDGAPAPRRGAFAVWTGERVLVWGGYDDASPVGGGALYDPAGDVWTAVSDSGAPSPRAGAATAWSGSELLVFGGATDDDNETSEGYAYDPVQNQWRSLPEADAPSARRDAFAAWVSGKLVLWGGRKDTESLETGALYDPAAGTWSPLTNDDNPSKRSRQYRRSGWVGAAGERALLLAGIDGNTLRRDGKLYDPAADAWIDAGSATKDHDNGAGVWTGAELILWSGRSGNNLDAKGERYRP